MPPHPRSLTLPSLPYPLTLPPDPYIHLPRWSTHIAPQQAHSACDVAVNKLIPLDPSLSLPPPSRDITSSTLSPAAPTTAAAGTLTVSIEAADGVRSIDLDGTLGEALNDALTQLERRLCALSPPLFLGATLFARVFYDHGLELEPSLVGRAASAAISRSGRRQAEAIGLPVHRVLAGSKWQARLAVQIHFTVSDLGVPSCVQ